MYAIGIDIGTTSICGVVLDTDTGQVIKSRTEQSNAFIATSNSWEKIQDTEKIIFLAREILDSFSEYPAAVIGLTGQMHGIVYVDAEGHAVSPLYTWQDGRGNLPYRDSTYAEHLGSFAGYGNVTDFYNRVNGIRPKEAVAYCTIMDYLGMVLCGLKTSRMHTTNAASLGCFDLKRKKFTYDVNVKVSDGFDIIGRYKGIPVSIAIGDNQASVFSTLADESDLLINVGTGSQVSMISDRIVRGENVETRPYFGGKYLVVGAAFCGGRAYGMLKDFYQEFLKAAAGASNVGAWVNGASPEVDIYAVMDRLIAGKTESSLKVDTRFAGTRQRAELRGQISNIGVNNFTPADLTYGVLDGMMEELHSMYAEMAECDSGTADSGADSQKRNRSLVGSGNGIRKNKNLIRIAEKKFGGKLRIPVHTEEAACGAALFGLVACGVFKNAGEAQKLIKYEI